MIKARLQIENGEICDITNTYGLVYLKADKRFASPIKDYEQTAYPEQPGYNVSPKTVDDAFEYHIEFFIKTDRLTRANKKISNFNNALYTKKDNVKTFKRVTFYDDYKGVKIVGYPKPMAEATEFWRGKDGNSVDIVCCKWVIEVNDPSLCDFEDGDVFAIEDTLVIDGDTLPNGNIVSGIEVFVEGETLIFKNI